MNSHAIAAAIAASLSSGESLCATSASLTWPSSATSTRTTIVSPTWQGTPSGGTSCTLLVGIGSCSMPSTGTGRPLAVNESASPITGGTSPWVLGGASVDGSATDGWI